MNKIGKVEFDEPYMSATIHYSGIEYISGLCKARIVGKGKRKYIKFYFDSEQMFSTHYLTKTNKEVLAIFDSEIIVLFSKFNSVKEFYDYYHTKQNEFTALYGTIKVCLAKL